MNDLEDIPHPRDIRNHLIAERNTISFNELDDRAILSQGIALNPEASDETSTKYGKHAVLIDLGEEPYDWVDAQTRASWSRGTELTSFRVYEWEVDGYEAEVEGFTYQTTVKDSVAAFAGIRKGPLVMTGDHERYGFEYDGEELRALESDYYASIQANNAVQAGERNIGSELERN